MKLSILAINNIFFCIVAVVLCLVAPDNLNIAFCQMIAGLYVLQNILHFVFLDKRNWLGFELFFAFAFFFINFVYPVFIYPILPDFSLFSFSFNSDLIPKSTAIAYLGYTFYLLGCTQITNIDREEPLPPTFNVETSHVTIIFFMTFFFFACYLVTGGLTAMKSVYSGGGDINEVGIYSYFKLLFTISSYLLAIFSFRLQSRIKWLFILSLLICMLMMLSTGSRTLTIGLVLIMVVAFNNNIRRFRWYEISIIVCMGILVLYYIMLNRTGNVTKEVTTSINDSDVGILSAFLDLIINNRNLYVLVDYASTHPLTYFHGMLIDITAPIPGISSILVSATGEPIELLHGGMLPTYLEFGTGSAFGLGTNMVGEAYRSFGYPGTIIMMFTIGHLVKTTYYMGRTNIYMYLLYYLLVSHSVMYGRGPIIMDLRLITWALALLYCINFPIKFAFNKLNKKEA